MNEREKYQLENDCYKPGRFNAFFDVLFLVIERFFLLLAEIRDIEGYLRYIYAKNKR